LHIAILNNNYQFIEILLQHSSDEDKKKLFEKQNNNGKTPLQLAIMEGNEANNALHIAILNNNYQFIEILLQLSSDEDKKKLFEKENNNGKTPLQLAIMNRNEKITNLLIDKWRPSSWYSNC
jgi:ankyrin repeat protein